MAAAALPSVRTKRGIMCCAPSAWMIELQPSWRHVTLATPGGAWGAGQIMATVHASSAHAMVPLVDRQQP